MTTPIEGKYSCRLNESVVIYEASTGSLCAALPCVVTAPPAYEGFSFKYTAVLVRSDGTILTKTTDTLKAVFGWDGVDPFWLMDQSQEGCPLRLAEFEVVGGPETGDRGGTYFKPKWLNPMGGGQKKPEAANRESVLAKYGSKFKALAESQNVPGATPATTRETRVLPPTIPRVPTTPPPTLQSATMEEAWAALNEANPGKNATAIEKLWFDTIGKLFPNKSNTDLKLHEWARLKAEFEKDELPM